MKYRNIVSIAFLSFVIAAAFASVDAQTISASFDENTLERGAVARGTILLSIPEGLHVNSNKPDSEYAIPTTARVTAVGLKPGTVEFPEGTNRKFQFSESELNVYEGEVKMPFSIDIPKNFQGNTLTVKALVRYQACTDEVCYPPKNKEITITAKIR